MSLVARLAGLRTSAGIIKPRVYQTHVVHSSCTAQPPIVTGIRPSSPKNAPLSSRSYQTSVNSHHHSQHPKQSHQPQKATSQNIAPRPYTTINLAQGVMAAKGGSEDSDWHDAQQVGEYLHQEAGIDFTKQIHRNLTVAELYEDALKYEDGVYISSTGALIAASGAKTGRSPSDKRIVEESSSSGDIWVSRRDHRGYGGSTVRITASRWLTVGSHDCSGAL